MKKWNDFSFGIWDTAGQEKFARISSYYTRGAQAAILSYDICDLESFQLLSNYVEFLQGAEKDCYLVLIGTKKDLADEGQRQVTEEQGKKFAIQLEASFYETSSKLDINVTRVFDDIGFHCLADRLRSEEEMPAKEVIQQMKIEEPKKKTCCCLM